MKTEVLKLEGASSDADKIRHAARLLQAGALVAFPTDTVYGLGADARNPEAIKLLIDAKGRPPDKPFALLVPSLAEAEKITGGFSRVARKLARLYWPGPLTLVVKRQDGSATGLRLPEHPVTRALLAQCGFALATPSANRSGNRDPRTVEEVLAEMDGRIPLILDGGPAWQGRPSTVALIDGTEPPKVQREGAVSEEQLLEAAQLTVLFVCTGNTCRSPMAEALCREIVKVRARPHLHYRVLSAGTRAIEGGGADPMALEVMREIHLDLGEHKTQALNPRLLDVADWIFTMTRAHRESILELMPECRDRIRLLSERGQDIPDPASKSLDHYRYIRARLAHDVAEAAKVIFQDAG
jgi:L-threonylcarbamoyladenylate synthase